MQHHKLRSSRAELEGDDYARLRERKEFRDEHEELAGGCLIVGYTLPGAKAGGAGVRAS